MSVYYFAYGSCMDEVDFKRTVPEFKTLGSAILKDYSLVFSLYGESRAGGVADIIPAPGYEVEGVLYQFPLKYLPLLDQREGVDRGMYERIEVNVSYLGKRIKAYTYQVLEKAVEEIPPSAHYLGLMLNGMNKYCTISYRKQFIERVKRQFNSSIETKLEKVEHKKAEHEKAEHEKAEHEKEERGKYERMD